MIFIEKLISNSENLYLTLYTIIYRMLREDILERPNSKEII